MDLAAANGAVTALTNVKAAITQLANDRATLGANLTRLNYTGDQLSVQKTNLASANSRIKDVDVAHESTEYAKYNILVQSGTAMLAQANQQPMAALRLLG
jgi:flagellin